MMNAEQRRAFVREHRTCIFAFQRNLGPPSMSVVYFGKSGDPMLALRVWVLVHELREGTWGAGGQTVSALDVAQFINSDLDVARRGEIAASVARQSRT